MTYQPAPYFQPSPPPPLPPAPRSGRAGTLPVLLLVLNVLMLAGAGIVGILWYGAHQAADRHARLEKLADAVPTPEYFRPGGRFYDEDDDAKVVMNFDGRCVGEGERCKSDLTVALMLWLAGGLDIKDDNLSDARIKQVLTGSGPIEKSFSNYSAQVAATCSNFQTTAYVDCTLRVTFRLTNS